MQVKFNELYKYPIGITVVIDGKWFMYMGTSELYMAPYFVDLDSGLPVYIDEIDESIEGVVIGSTEVDYDKLIKFKSDDVLRLINDGDTDLDKDIAEVATIVKLRNAINQ